MTIPTQDSDPYENAIAERVNGILKDEFNLEEFSSNKKIMNQIVKESILIYNQLRLHWSCTLLTPEQMHQQCDITKPSYHKKLAVSFDLLLKILIYLHYKSVNLFQD